MCIIHSFLIGIVGYPSTHNKGWFCTCTVILTSSDSSHNLLSSAAQYTTESDKIPVAPRTDDFENFLTVSSDTIEQT